jgi:hypothetical protein
VGLGRSNCMVTAANDETNHGACVAARVLTRIGKVVVHRPARQRRAATHALSVFSALSITPFRLWVLWMTAGSHLQLHRHS